MAVRLFEAFSEQERPRETDLARIFEEEPVSLSVFVQDKKYLANPPLSLVQYDAVRHIERVYLPEMYPLMAEEFGGYWADPVRMVNLVTLQWGKGGGKDHICRIASLRVAYMLLCLKSPQRYFEMPDQDSIQLLNIASNAGQANIAFFKPMTKAVQRGWFKDKADPKQGLIQYDKQIEAISGHSEAEGQEGLNIMLGVADEIDAFKAKDEFVGQGKKMREASNSAESILDMLKTSASTRFPDCYKRVAISYPRYLGSTIQKLTAAGKADNELMGEKSRQYVSGPLATWDVNPRVKGKEKFSEDYRTDPVAAAAKYECKPSRAIDAFYKNPSIFQQAVDQPDQPIHVSYRLTQMRSGKTSALTTGWEPVYTFDPEFKPIQGVRYAMHGDLALVGDRAGIAMSHVVRYEEQTHIVTDEEGGEYEETTVVPIIRNDFTIAFEADSSTAPAREIQIRWAQELAFELIKRGFYIAQFTFDGFQSADTIQTLLRHGIESERVSADLRDDVWRTLKDVASDGRLLMPFSQLLQNELEGLSKINGKVDHPPGGCFVGETRIPLLDGTFPQISELEGKEVWVYSADTNGKIKPGLARGRKTKETTELLDVILDNGYVARCTPEHRWMLRDGSYKEARSLVPGVDRLMPVTFNWPVNGGYSRVTDKDGVRTLGHHMVAEHVSGRTRADDEVVHHKNENKTDNRPENLEIISQLEHVTHHAHDLWAQRLSGMRAGHAQWAQDPERKVKAYAGRRLPRYRDDITYEAIQEVARGGAENIAEAARALSCDWNVVSARLKAEGVLYSDMLLALNNNHKVRAVVPVRLETPVPVYDLEVDEWSNFALSGGVFVHNSKDLADAFACSITGAIVAGGEEDADGNTTEVGEPLFEVGSALAPYEGMSEQSPDLIGGFSLPLGMKGMGLHG